MEGEKQKNAKSKEGLLYHGYEVVASMPHYTIPQVILIWLRLIPIAVISCLVILFQEYVRPQIMIPAVRRYLSCVVNLFYLRIVLLIMGFIRFECEGYRYFDKSSRMLSFRSGWAGMALHKNFLDFLYYAYMFNPVFTRVIQYHSPKGLKMLYTPLSFKDAFFAALSHRGFDPVILNGEAEFKKFKHRKMELPVLVSECFEETNGPILIMLPGVAPNEHIPVHDMMARDIFQNQRKFVRSGVTFISETGINESNRNAERGRHNNEAFEKVYANQTHLVMELCSKLSVNTLTITAHDLLKNKYEYTEETFSAYVDQYFVAAGLKLTLLSFEEYLGELDALDEVLAAHED